MKVLSKRLLNRESQKQNSGKAKPKPKPALKKDYEVKTEAKSVKNNI